MPKIAYKQIAQHATLAAKKAPRLRSIPADETPPDEVEIETQFEPEYILESDGTIILFRNKNF